MRSARGPGAVLAAAGLLAILVLTLEPHRGAGDPDLTPPYCLVCGENGGADVVLNLLLFMPFAAGLAMLGLPLRRIAAACALLSLGVETLQSLPLINRDASLSDLLTNTIGGTAGAALVMRLELLLAPGPALARRLAAVAAAAWLGVLGLTAAGLRPWAPEGPLWNYCSAAFPTGETFSGTARTMVLDDIPLECDRVVAASDAVREEVRRGRVQLETTARSGDPEYDRLIIHMVRSSDAAVLILAQHGRAAVFQAPVASLALRLFAPSVRLDEAMPRADGMPVALTAGMAGRRLRLAVEHEGGRREVELALSPSFGWTFLFDRPIGPDMRLRLGAALWVGLLLVPAAYWAARTRRPAGALGLAAVVIGGLGLLPALTGFDPVHWSEWLGAAGGIVLGWALSHFAAYLQSRCGSPSTSAYSSS